MSQAKGEYITFIDDDDYVSSEYLQRLFEASDKEAIVLADSRAFVDGKTSYIEYGCHNTYLRCAKCRDQSLIRARSLFNGPCMKSIPKDFVHDINFDTKIANGEDGLFMFEVSRNVKLLKYASEDAVYYRRYRINSATTQSRSKSYWVKNSLLLSGKYIKVWLSHPFSYNVFWAVNRILSNFKAVIWHLKTSYDSILNRPQSTD